MSDAAQAHANLVRAERLYQLLPQIFRAKDLAQPGQPLRALFQVLQAEYDALEANIDGLYADWFIETCQQWVVPYIGALIGIDDIDTDAANIWSERARVGNAAHWRARPGTLATIAQSAAAVTGWPAIAIDLGANLVASQHLNAVQPANWGSARLSGKSVADAWLPGNSIAHTAKVDAPRPGRWPNATDNLYNLGQIGVVLWRHAAFPLAAAVPGRCGRHFAFHPAGIETPLFVAPSSFITHSELPTEADMPRRLTRALLAAMLHAAIGSDADGTTLPLAIQERGTDNKWQPVTPDRWRVWPLSPDAPPPQVAPPPAVRSPRPTPTAPFHGMVALASPPPAADTALSWQPVFIDPEAGLFSYGAGPAPARDDLRVCYAYGFGADFGGGPYCRGNGIVGPEPGHTRLFRVTVEPPHKPDGTIADGWFDSLAAALDAVQRDPRLDDVLIEIVDNAAYELLHPTTLTLVANAQLAIQAIDGARPTVSGDLLLQRPGNEPARALLGGMLWLGGATIDGPISLEVHDCTLGMQRPRALAAVHTAPGTTARAGLYVARSIVGPIRMSSLVGELEVDASIVDGRASVGDTAPLAIAGDQAGAPGAVPMLRTSTLLGDLNVAGTVAPLDCVIDGTITTPTGVQTGLSTRPRFVSRRWGDPAYLQLAPQSASDYQEGASDGGELGVYGMLKSRWRIRNLRTALQRHVPQGLSCAVVFAT